MPSMTKAHTKAHNAFLALKRPFDPTNVYIAFCKLVGLKEEAIERGLGKLFREGKLKSPEDRPRKSKSNRSRGPVGDPDDFR